MKKVVIGLFLLMLSVIFIFLYYYKSYDKESNRSSDNQEFKNIIDLTLLDKNEFLTKSNIEIPIYEYLIPQGLTIVDDKIFISVYDNMGLKNSKVYVIDMKGNIINVTTLDTNSHVGGLAYDRINNLMWIPDDNGELNGYKIQDFYKKSHSFYKYKYKDLCDGLVDYKDYKKNAIDYLTIVDDYMYIGNFSLNNKGLIKKYKISSNAKLDYVSEFKVIDKVQGITFYKDYMLLSTSYGRKKESYLYVYKYEDNMITYNEALVIYKLPSMMEQIYTYKNNIYLTFENTAKKYFDSIDKIGYICILDGEKIVK